MSDRTFLPCDGCGQLASAKHIARRLRRLEYATRFRPVHVQTLLLGGIAPGEDSEFLYAPEGVFTGEAQGVLQGSGIRTEGKSREAVQAEFQKRGLLLTHVLDCPVEAAAPPSPPWQLLEWQLPWTMARIRRAIRPKRVFLLSAELGPVIDRLRQADLGCPLWPPISGAYLSGLASVEVEVQALREAFRALEA